jgi:nucleoside-diphosphate-sugar epimerase
MGKSARLLPLPPAILRFAGRLIGKRAEMERLLGSLALDDGLIRRELDWSPPFALDQGLALTVADYLRARGKVPASSR